MKKIIRNGNVAVLFSPGFGAGWSTWNDDDINEILLFHPAIVRMVEEKRQDELTEEWLMENCGIKSSYICVLGAESLSIQWIKKGTAFIIEEYDGHESIKTPADMVHTA